MNVSPPPLAGKGWRECADGAALALRKQAAGRAPRFGSRTIRTMLTKTIAGREPLALMERKRL